MPKKEQTGGTVCSSSVMPQAQRRLVIKVQQRKEVHASTASRANTSAARL